MRYRIRRIRPGSALRVGCVLGWLVMLCPALCLAGLAMQILQRVNQTLGRIAPFDIVVLGQPIAHIDLLDLLRLSDTAQTVGRLNQNQLLTFLAITLLLMLVGAIILTAAGLLFSVGYNLLASLGGGLEVELHEEE